MPEYTMIDVDTHITEVPDLWQERLPARLAERAPRMETDDRGRNWWMIGGKRAVRVGLTATAGVGDMKHPPNGYDDIHPGAYDAHERLKYMDDMGIWAMVLYPNVGGFGAQEFLRLDDPELMLGMPPLRGLASTLPGSCNWQMRNIALHHPA